MNILQNGPDIQHFSRTASGLRAQLLLLDFQVNQSFQFFFRRTASVFREHGHHPDGSAVRNLDTFHPNFLLAVWLVYGRKPPVLTVSPVCNFEPIRTYSIIIFVIVWKPLLVNSPKAAYGVTYVVASHVGLDFVNSQNPIFAVPAHAVPDGSSGAQGLQRRRRRPHGASCGQTEGYF